MSTFANHTDRIDRALEGLLSEAEHDGLKADIVQDAALREQYVEQLWLHSALRARRESLAELLAAEPAPEPKVIHRWPVAAWAAAAAACLTLAASALFFGKGVVYGRPVATLVQAENCEWAGSDLPTAVNSKLGPGTLALVEGIATLRFKNGATVTIEAPTKLLIQNAMHCRLLEGSLVADVPEPAHGFTIDTADMKVVDLGTKFGVTAGSAGNSQVRVFQGEVEVARLGESNFKRLTEGKGMHVGSDHVAAGQEPTHGAETTVPQEDGWTAISTAYGRGKDAYVRRGDMHGATARQPLLMVKHSELKESLNNERRAYLSFDLARVAGAPLQEAKLVLDPEPSGFGFSALVPDSRFALYGLADEALDQWDEHALRWGNAPGCNDAGVLPAQARKLAEFWIPRGGSGESLTIRGEPLAQFLREDTNGLATFLIVRETGESDPTGLVHAFASKEHPTARPPTLMVR